MPHASRRVHGRCWLALGLLSVGLMTAGAVGMPFDEPARHAAAAAPDVPCKRSGQSSTTEQLALAAATTDAMRQIDTKEEEERGLDADHVVANNRVYREPDHVGKPAEAPGERRGTATSRGWDQRGLCDGATPTVAGGAAPSDGDIASGPTTVVTVTNSKYCFAPIAKAATATCVDLSAAFGQSSSVFLFDAHVEWTSANMPGQSQGTFIILAGDLNSPSDRAYLAKIPASSPASYDSRPVHWDYLGQAADKFDIAVTRNKVVAKGMSGVLGGTVRLDVFNLSEYLGGARDGVNADTVTGTFHQRIDLRDQPGYMMAKQHGAYPKDAAYMYATVGSNIVRRKVDGLPPNAAVYVQTVEGSDSRISGSVNGMIPGGTINFAWTPQVESAGYVLVQTPSSDGVYFGSIPVDCPNLTDMCAITFKHNVGAATFSTRLWRLISGSHIVMSSVMVNNQGQEFLTYSHASTTSLPSATMWGPNFHYFIAQPVGATSATSGSNVRWGDYFGSDIHTTASGSQVVFGLATNAEGGGSAWGESNWNAHFVGADQNGFLY